MTNLLWSIRPVEKSTNDGSLLEIELNTILLKMIFCCQILRNMHKRVSLLTFHCFCLTKLPHEPNTNYFTKGAPKRC